jgi:hypothetical protein
MTGPNYPTSGIQLAFIGLCETVTLRNPFIFIFIGQSHAFYRICRYPRTEMIYRDVSLIKTS